MASKRRLFATNAKSCFGTRSSNEAAMNIAVSVATSRLDHAPPGALAVALVCYQLTLARSAGAARNATTQPITSSIETQPKPPFTRGLTLWFRPFQAFTMSTAAGRPHAGDIRLRSALSRGDDDIRAALSHSVRRAAVNSLELDLTPQPAIGDWRLAIGD